MRVRRTIIFLAVAAILVTAFSRTAEAATTARDKWTVTSDKVFVPGRYCVSVRNEKIAAN